ncbi:hypothetical protein [Streptomyces sp. AD55]
MTAPVNVGEAPVVGRTRPPAGTAEARRRREAGHSRGKTPTTLR